MKSISVTNDIIPIGKFKTGLSKWFKSVQSTGHPLIITQNGKPAGVLLSPSEYDELVHEKASLDSIRRGVADANAGRVLDEKGIRAALVKKRNPG